MHEAEDLLVHDADDVVALAAEALKGVLEGAEVAARGTAQVSTMWK